MKPVSVVDSVCPPIGLTAMHGHGERSVGCELHNHRAGTRRCEDITIVVYDCGEQTTYVEFAKRCAGGGEQLARLVLNMSLGGAGDARYIGRHHSAALGKRHCYLCRPPATTRVHTTYPAGTSRGETR